MVEQLISNSDETGFIAFGAEEVEAYFREHHEEMPITSLSGGFYAKQFEYKGYYVLIQHKESEGMLVPTDSDELWISVYSDEECTTDSLVAFN